MKTWTTAITAILILSSLSAHAKWAESIDDQAIGRAKCKDLLYEFSGNNPSVSRAKSLLIEAFADGLYDDATYAVPSRHISQVDAELVQFLAHKLEKSLTEVIGEYSNGAMMLSHVYEMPGELNSAIRVQSARSMIHSTPWISAARAQELDRRVEQIALGK